MWGRRKYKPFWFLVTVLFIILVGFVGYVETRLTPAIVNVAEAKTQLEATRIINEAVQRNVGNINYHDMIQIHKDKDQRIVMMTPDIVKINQLATSTTLDIEKKLGALETQGFSIPLGLITGSTLFSNTGPLINIGIVPIGLIEVDLQDEFSEAGINQTRHKIYLYVKTKLQVVVPFIQSRVDVAVKIPVTESIILGPVPEWYMHFSLPEMEGTPGLNFSMEDANGKEYQQLFFKN